MKKRTILCGMILMIFSGLQVIAAGTDKTVTNLKAAFKGELTASSKYSAFAAQAKKEGFTQIASMFDATSKAETIHAANHKTVLLKMGQAVDPIKPEFTVKSTKENLEDAIAGETYEMTQMYPDFIATAKAEGVDPAGKSFRWAMDTEKKHQVMYQKTLDALNAKKIPTLSTVYYVCPKCGNTYDVANPEASCAFCSTKKDKYIKFGK